MIKHIVKRAGHSEPYNSKKLYDSIYSSCLAVREPVDSSKEIAKKITKEVDKWLDTKPEITVHDIRDFAGKKLLKANHHAGYLYLHHRIMW